MTAQVILTCASCPLASDASGNIGFYDGVTQIGSVSVSNGIASFQTPPLTVGPHTLMARYGGDNNYLSSVSTPFVFTVDPLRTSTTIVVVPNRATSGQPVTLTATVSPSNATGSIAFKDNGNTFGTITLTNGTAIFTTSLAPGSHLLTAVYSGDSNNAASTSPAVDVVVPPPVTSTNTSLSSSLNPSNVGQPVTLTATVMPASATGTVTFKDGANTIGMGTLGNGTATFTTSTLSVGSHPLIATYSGDSNNNPSTSPTVTEVVNPLPPASTVTVLVPSPNPAVSGQTVTLTATVTPASATGTVTFKDSATTIGTGTLSGGSATVTTSTLSVGNHTITATYSGDSSNNPSTSQTVTEVVNPLPPASTVTALVPSPNPAVSGQTVILTATVTPASATGTVTFKDGANTIGLSTLSGGTATIAISTLTV
ncbi:MAG TPA: Ig-like domain-containing protein, partial [Bryobacteraceae bacterium]|nr:Ig-like domain-containing protein [Bryobacteraceae bacterium]